MSSRGFLVVLFVAFMAFAGAQQENDDRQEGDISFRPIGRSGKLLFGRKGKGGRKVDLTKESFTLELDYLKQIDEQQRDVGKSINSFASQSFTISPFNKTASFQGVSAACLTLTTKLQDSDVAQLRLTVYIFKEEGNLTFGNDSFLVQNGTIKLLIEVENFTFCDGTVIPSVCKQNEIGKYLEIGVIVKNKKGDEGREESEQDKEKRQPGGAKKRGIRCFKNKCPKILDFNGDEVGLSNQCKIDGKFKALAPGYPKFLTQGSKQLFLFRGQKFYRTIIFDPVVELKADEDEDGDGDGDGEEGGHASAIYMNGVMFVVILGALFL